MKEYGLQIDWDSTPPGLWKLPGGPSLQIHWSSGLAPLDRFVILDSTKNLWKVKLDPVTAHRLTVVIGEPNAQPHTVRFLAETVVKYEILDPGAIYSILVEGEPGSEGS
jgi:hypothetical protein